MKTKVLSIVAMLAATAAFAQTNQVLSKNAVGYIRVNVPNTNKLAFVSTPFRQLSGTDYATVPTLLGATAPAGTTVFIWKNAIQAYVSEVFDGDDQIWLPGTNLIGRGEGFWIKTAAGAAATNFYTVYLMGEVPTNDLPKSMTGGGSLGAIGISFPVDTTLTNSALGQAGTAGDTATAWTITNQSYSSSVFDGDDLVWTVDLPIKAGQAMWFKNVGTTFNWTQPKPYTWP